ncbi:hypothetical protein BJY00DRAFT_325448 [Aspergillus carlsbadensis]|nr:hypothetical protein BJY00DRAFT_325448 [Aspergillus carlsbadensis]
MDLRPSNSHLSLIPMRPPPPGEVSNFVDPDSISWVGRLSIYLTLPIMVIAVILRVYVRLSKRKVGTDDWLLVFGAFHRSPAIFTLAHLQTDLNDIMGRHAWDIPISALRPWFFKYTTIAGTLYNISAMSTKISVLAFYLRIFSISPRARIFIWTGIILIGVGYVTLSTLWLTWTVPHRGDGGWGSLANVQRVGQSSGRLNLALIVFSVVSDLYVIAIPTVIVLRLRLPLRKKMVVACVFLISLVSLGCCIANTVPRYRVFVFEDAIDNMRVGIRIQALCITELNIGISCACVPVFFVLLKSWMRSAESGVAYLRHRLPSPHGSKEAGVITDVPLGSLPHHLTQSIPTGTLSRLTVVFHRVGRGTRQAVEMSDWEAAEGSTVQVSRFSELRSIDYDYHAQIWSATPNGSERSLIAKQKNESRGRGAEGCPDRR